MKFKLNLDQVDEILSEFGVTLKTAKEAGAHLRSRPSRTGRKSPAQIEQENLEAVEKGRDLDKIENPSERVTLAAIKRDARQIRFVKNPSEALQLEALQVNYIWYVKDVIGSIENPTEAAKMLAVRRCGAVIEHISQPWSDELVMEAINQDGMVLELVGIRHFKLAPPENVCLTAVRQDPHAIRLVQNQTEEMKLEAVSRAGILLEFVKKPSEEVQLEAVRQNGDAIKFVKNPSMRVQLEAVRQRPASIRFVENPSEEVQLEAVHFSPNAIVDIDNPTPAVVMEAVSANGMLVQNRSFSLTDEMKLAAVRQNGLALQFFKNEPEILLEELELAAVKQNWQAMQFVMNPSAEVLREFLTHYVTETVMKA